ncbi:MAG: hypothetical protein R3C14_29625 [Caldilineaceae bacterium]
MVQFIGCVYLALAIGSEAAVDALTQKLVADGYACLEGPGRTDDGCYESVVLESKVIVLN